MSEPFQASSSAPILVIGAGLAGTEAAWQIARAGLPVRLVEMRPVRRSPAHHSSEFAELVCSNSFGALSSDRAAGLLQEELRRLGSLVIGTADQHAVPAGGALAVDRGRYSAALTAALEQHPLVTVERREHTDLPGPGEIAVLATGPLTSEPLAEALRAFTGRADCHFFDAASPIVEGESIDLSVAFRASRYDKGDADYINCEVRRANRAYAVVQLRQEDKDGRLWNLVGFQTNLKWGEQKRVLRLIPGLENAEFVRFGVMHRNTFLEAPQLLDPSLQFRQRPTLLAAGQITGTEGYAAAVAGGWLAGTNAARLARGLEPISLPPTTMIGALTHFIASAPSGKFQPMPPNFGLLPELPERIKAKRERYGAYRDRALVDLEPFTGTSEPAGLVQGGNGVVPTQCSSPAVMSAAHLQPTTP